MEVALPGWRVAHTGGGVLVAVRGFPLAGGRTAAVTVTDDVACLHRKVGGGYATAREWLNYVKDIEEEEEIGWLEIGGPGREAFPIFKLEAAELLGEGALREIARAMEEMAGL